MTIKAGTTTPRPRQASDDETTPTTAPAAIPVPALDRLVAEVTGPVLVPGDEQYVAETATWNLAVDYQPAVAVGAAGVADVQAAVRFAGTHNLPVAVVATGHGAVGPADPGLLINLRRMDDIVVDREQRTATAGAAVLRAAAPTLIDSVREMPFTDVASIHNDPVDPVPACESSAQLADFPREAGDALIAAAGPQADTPALMVEIRQLGGALSREPQEPNAVGNRDARFQLFAVAVGDPSQQQTLRPALQSLVDALAPWETGTTQINFLTSGDTTPEAVSKAYEPAAFERLVRIKNDYDPQDLFRVNHNIAAAKSAA